MQLSLRLSAIAGLVTRGNRLVDVGCDHGYLPVSLYLDGKIPGAIAMDVRKGPLSRAQEHISQYGLDPVLREYLERELRIRNEILDRLKNAPNAEKRAGEIEEEKQAVIAALEEYEGI